MINQQLLFLYIALLLPNLCIGFVPRAKGQVKSFLEAETLEEVLPIPTNEVVQTVGVAGATGAFDLL